MTERVADKQTEEGSPPGVLREHEIVWNILSAGCSARVHFVYLQTEGRADLTVKSNQGQERDMTVALERMPEGSRGWRK